MSGRRPTRTSHRGRFAPSSRRRPETPVSRSVANVATREGGGIIPARTGPLSIHFEHQEVDVILPRTRRGTRGVVLAAFVVVACLAVPSSRHRPIRPARRSKARSRARSRDRTSPVLAETYPFFSTWHDLAASGYVEEEFYLSGAADAYATTGAKLASTWPTRPA